MKNLLPGAEHQLALFNRDHERWSEHRGLQMRVAVAIVPGLLVAVVAAGREQLVQDCGQILLQARFKFNRADGPGTANVENVCEARAQARFAHDSSHLLRKVVHLAVTRRLNLEFALINHL